MFNQLIMVASWEDRCLLGFEKNIQDHKINAVVIYYYLEYESISTHNIDKISILCKKNNIICNKIPLSFTHESETWVTLSKIMQYVSPKDSVLLDITTMPRDTIWILLDMLSDICDNVKYVYYLPKKYNSDWLSHDPGIPRIVYKLGGISRAGLHLVLLIVAGYDNERIKQLIHAFEPEHIYLCVQSGDMFNNIENRNKIQTKFKKYSNIISIMEIDSFDGDHGYNVLNDIIIKNRNNNILMSSLGPKLSAITLFNIHKNYEETALVYTPSFEYNYEYSTGIGDAKSGCVDLKKII